VHCHRNHGFQDGKIVELIEFADTAQIKAMIA
jgi:ketosteroid isomerase-like protein